MPVTHVVGRGESLSAIAARHGRRKQDILDHPDNLTLKAKRKNPEALLPGDRLTIPDFDERLEDVATEREHTFVVEIPTIEVKLRVVDHLHRALAGKQYRLEHEAARWQGTLGDDGDFSHDLPASATTATLRVWLHDKDDDGDDEGDLVYPLHIGGLDPHDEPSGVQMRLAGLGYAVSASGQIDDATRSALRAFQKRHGLTASGEADAETQEELRRIHEEAT